MEMEMEMEMDVADCFYVSVANPRCAFCSDYLSYTITGDVTRHRTTSHLPSA